MQHPSPRFYTPKEVARILGTTPRTLRRWELAGVIPQATTDLGRKKWPRDVIDNLVGKVNGRGCRSVLRC